MQGSSLRITSFEDSQIGPKEGYKNSSLIATCYQSVGRTGTRTEVHACHLHGETEFEETGPMCYGFILAPWEAEAGRHANPYT